MQGSRDARTLRKRMTLAESKLWFRLRDRRFGNHKFRRQFPIGHYIADFVCISAGVIVEVDGGQHASNTAYDQARTRYLESQDYLVLRFWNNDVLGNMDGILEALTLTLSQRERE